jgi:Holliday junction resolvase RusA-like endonuclease
MPKTVTPKPAIIDRRDGEVRVRLDVEPVPASRPRVSPRGIAYYAGPYKAFQKLLKTILPPAAETLMGELLVEVHCVCKPLKASKFTTPMGDCDNLAKGPLDALKDQGFFGDDRQIVDLHVTKRFPRAGEEPHIEIHIKEL